MAFIASANTVTVTAKLTPFGRQQLLANTASVISHFSLGDSDANYRTLDILDFGKIPSMAGNLAFDGSISNSVSNGLNLRYKILVNNSGTVLKPIEVNSKSINITEKNTGVKTITNSSMASFVVNRNDTLTNPLTNLFSSFGLPITDIQKTQYETVNDNFGGFANTALSNLNQDKILVVSFNPDSYSEMLDGRVIKLTITTSGNTYNIFSTYQKSLTKLATQDVKTSEISKKSSLIGDNISFLFSDNIQKPNFDRMKSWSTGFNTVKPFSVNNKELFNLTTNGDGSQLVDKTVGVVYLDKGFIVITEPEIVNNFSSGNTLSLTYDSLGNDVSQDITCIVNRGEFIASTNPTYNTGDVIRVSEIGLHDTNGNLMAIAKTNKQILIGTNQFLALGLKISV